MDHSKTLAKLSDEQLRQCWLDTGYMVARPGNGVTEYRQSIADEQQRRIP